MKIRVVLSYLKNSSLELKPNYDKIYLYGY